MGFTFALKNLFAASVSNEQLMLRYAAADDNQCLADLYTNCADDLYHFLITLSNPELAKEISQRTWLKVIEKKYLYKSSGRFSAWLFTLGRNLLVDEIRKNTRLCELNELSLPQSNPPEFTDSDMLSNFNHALEGLPFEQREAFCLQQEGFGLQEIASITGSPIETIKSRLRYAKASLKLQLEKYHE